MRNRTQPHGLSGFSFGVARCVDWLARRMGGKRPWASALSPWVHMTNATVLAPLEGTRHFTERPLARKRSLWPAGAVLWMEELRSHASECHLMVREYLGHPQNSSST